MPAVYLAFNLMNNTNHPEFERREIPVPLGQRARVVRLAVQSAIDAHNAAFPETHADSPVYPTASFINPMFSAVQQVEKAAVTEISNAYHAVEQAYGATDDLQDAA